ncbi:MAG: TorF family putative porin [Pseudomonadota bacterium]
MNKSRNVSKKSLLSLAVSSVVVTSALLSTHVQAEGISANVALTSDYYFRGVSQTMNDPAIQGGFDWAHDSGVYAGIWASNVDFGDDTTIETDFYAGFSGEAANFGYDLGLIYYWYDDVSGTGSRPVEFYVNGSFNIFSVGYAYSPKFFSDKESHYLHAGLDYELPAEFALSASVGRSMGDAYGDNEYTDYKIGVSKSLAGIDLDLSYVGNDHDSNDDVFDNKVILTVSKSF